MNFQRRYLIKFCAVLVCIISHENCDARVQMHQHSAEVDNLFNEIDLEKVDQLMTPKNQTLIVRLPLNTLLKYTDYKDISILHFKVPDDTRTAFFGFKAYEEGKSTFHRECKPRSVDLHLKSGSFPVISPENITFPKNFLSDDQRSKIYSLKLQSNEEQQHILIEGPLLGDWFAIAFISWTDPKNDRIEQQGLTSSCDTLLFAEMSVLRCQPSILCAGLSQSGVLSTCDDFSGNNVNLDYGRNIDNDQSNMEKRNEFIYKFYVPSNIGAAIALISIDKACKDCPDMVFRIQSKAFPKPVNGHYSSDEQNSIHSLHIIKSNQTGNISFEFYVQEEAWHYVHVEFFRVKKMQSACSQHHSLINTPPILYVPERNWRIPETEPVGQIITRIRAEDPENDDLVFGLEPHFTSNFDNNNNKENLPFRIDSVRGIVYLNESLVGRGGENFFLYITVSDGDLTAKNEVFVNILVKENENSSKFRTPPSVTNVLQNISQILPPFDTLPGVQSERKKFSTERPTNRLKLAPLNNNNKKNFASGMTTIKYDYVNKYNDSVLHFNKMLNDTAANDDTTKKEDNKLSYDNTSSTNYSTKAIVLLVIFISSGILFVAVVVFGFLYRKHLCAISKKLKKISKEEMTKKSNQSNLSINLTDNSRNSMVMRHWNGPTAYNNRYVPWERDLQQNGLATYQQSSNVINGSIHDDNTNVTTNFSGLQNTTENIGHSINEMVSHNTNDNSKYNNNDKCNWEFPRHRLKFFNILGEGAFGQVWRCEANDIDSAEGVTTVAVKTLKENATESEKRDLMSELEVMKSLDPHINVVRLLACCTDKDPIFVIIEFVNRGKLQTYLRNSRAEMHYGNTHGKSKTLTSGDLTSFMYQVAKGMDYLTSRGIIHRDLAARNILITEEHTCKVADFGFARDVITSKIYERKSEGKLPIRWMAIESLYDNIFSAKSDIWSFGVLMWEIVTLGSTPYPGICAADVMRKVRDGYRLEKPEHCRRELYNIMYYCWSSDPNERPTFVELVQMLDKLLHTEMDYIELERFPDHNYYNILNLSGEKL